MLNYIDLNFVRYESKPPANDLEPYGPSMYTLSLVYPVVSVP